MNYIYTRIYRLLLGSTENVYNTDDYVLVHFPFTHPQRRIFSVFRQLLFRYPIARKIKQIL